MRSHLMASIVLVCLAAGCGRHSASGHASDFRLLLIDFSARDKSEIAARLAALDRLDPKHEAQVSFDERHYLFLASPGNVPFLIGFNPNVDGALRGKYPSQRVAPIGCVNRDDAYDKRIIQFAQDYNTALLALIDAASG